MDCIASYIPANLSFIFKYLDTSLLTIYFKIDCSLHYFVHNKNLAYMAWMELDK